MAEAGRLVVEEGIPLAQAALAAGFADQAAFHPLLPAGARMHPRQWRDCRTWAADYGTSGEGVKRTTGNFFSPLLKENLPSLEGLREGQQRI